MKTFRSADGVECKVDAVLPGSSNAMILFRHPALRVAGIRFPETWFERSGAMRFWARQRDEHGAVLIHVGVALIGLMAFSMLAIDYGVTGPPETFFVDADGLVRYRQFGPLTDARMADLLDLVLPVAAR